MDHFSITIQNNIRQTIKKIREIGIDIGFVQSSTKKWHIYEDNGCHCSPITVIDKQADIIFDDVQHQLCFNCFSNYYHFNRKWLLEEKRQIFPLIYPCRVPVKRGKKRKRRCLIPTTEGESLCFLHKKKLLDKYLVPFPMDVAKIIYSFL